MMFSSRFRIMALALSLGITLSTFGAEKESALIFGEKFPSLDNLATGEWWKRGGNAPAKGKGKAKKGKAKPQKRNIDLNVPRDQVIGFTVYTQDSNILKMSAQLYPLKDGEDRVVRLEIKEGENWKEIAQEKVVYPGWSAHFRIRDWDSTKDHAYRVRHGEKAEWSGVIRKDPIDKEEITVGSLSCNSTRTPGPRPNIIKNLLHHDPDFLFFAGDQTYHHTQHTMGWLQFGLQFREVMKDRPTVTITDDHDIGQGNLWGESGIQAETRVGDDGGYVYPPAYVNMVERQQTWHLPDAWDPRPIERGINVYFTRLRVGGIDFAILEDRKFKSGPKGKIPKMGPRADHINDPAYDRASVDLPELKLLGDRQIKFLNEWGQDWTGADMKVVLSQTAFCGAVHKHGSESNRLLADLDSNAWPQTGRNKALREIRRVWASHLCGDQHLAVVVKHGIDSHSDGPYGFTGPAIINTIYGRWWHPENEKAGPNAIAGSPLPWTGDYLDGLGNKITMHAYANPEDRSVETKRKDGYGIVRLNKKTGKTVFESWDRFCDASTGEGQHPGWPIVFNMKDNDGRKVTHHLPEMSFGIENPVIQVIEESSGDTLYTVRHRGNKVSPQVYAAGKYTVKYGEDKPDKVKESGVEAVAK